MPSLSKQLTSRQLATLALGCALALAPLSRSAFADDRDLFLSASARPLVFTVLDTSGSMNELPTNGNISLGSADSPNSKMYQAKEALYRVLKDLDADAVFGFAHYNQESLGVHFKEWLYTRKSGQTDPPWWFRDPDFDIEFPPAGAPVWFGPNVENEALVGSDDLGTCNNPLMLNDAQVLNVGTGATTAQRETVLIEQFEAFPKLGADGTATSNIYFDAPGFGGFDHYRFRFQMASGSTLGDPEITVTVTLQHYDNGCGSSPVDIGSQDIVFEAYYSADNEGLEFRDGSGPLGFDFLNRQQVLLADGANSSRLVRQGDFTRSRSIDSLTRGTTEGGSRNCNSYVQWDPNNNAATGNNRYPNSQLAYPTTPFSALAPDFTRGGACSMSNADTAFDRGDVIPWDWEDQFVSSVARTHSPVVPAFERFGRDEILARLAPNTTEAGEFHVKTTADETAGRYPNFAVGEAIPDFRIARYFENVPSSGTLQLKTKFQDTPPLTGLGYTPLAGVLDDIGNWFDEWKPCAQDPDYGDRYFDCRNRFVIFLTDGAETCGGNPGGAAATLRAKGIRTFVIGFGSGVSAGSLQDMADEGGTGQDDTDSNPDTTQDCEAFDTCPGPILAADQDALVDALKKILTQVNTRPTSVAGTAVPTNQAANGQSIFYSTFIPSDKQPIYATRLGQFIYPLPTTTDTNGDLVTDFSARCTAPDDQECLVWEADEVMRGVPGGSFSQVPTAQDLMLGNYKIGTGTGERRLYYAPRSTDPQGDDVGRLPMLLDVPSDPNDNYYLKAGIGNASLTDVELGDLIKDVVGVRTIPDPSIVNGTIQFVLGDIFHSSPVVSSSPIHADYFTANLPAGSAPEQFFEDCAASNRGYQCFALQHRYRRKILWAGASDGQLHAFDAGTFDSSVAAATGRQNGTYNRGTGQELLSFVPKALLPRLGNLAPSDAHMYGVDNQITFDDVNIDALHAGTPTPGDREWRTVLVGALREGGKEVFALDITQPDTYTLAGKESVPVANTYVPSCFGSNAPSCGTVPFGTVLWELTDSEDADLGFTWSKPTLGRILVNTKPTGTPTLVSKYVAIFGGGLDPDDTTKGHYLYMVDIETGKPLYKRLLSNSGSSAAVPSEPAVVDTDSDGLIDRIYVGNVDGILFKVDISTPPFYNDSSSSVSGTPAHMIDLADWEPFPIFNTSGRPLFSAPSVVFVAQKGLYALAFGTGDREDLWNPARRLEEGRFYFILDENFDATTGVLTEADYTSFTSSSTFQFGDLLLNGFSGARPGWVMQLDPAEKVLARPFSAAGITVFTSFTPQTGGGATCFFAGRGRAYVVYTTSGNPVLTTNPTGSGMRIAQEGPQLFANPAKTIESTGNSNIGPEAAAVREELKKLFPAGCRFLNTSIDIALDVQNGIQVPAQVPQCERPVNWGVR